MWTTTSRILILLGVSSVVGWIGLQGAASVGSNGRAQAPPAGDEVPIELTTTDLEPATCGDHFLAHRLAHTTTPSDRPARLFDSNGSGVAADDLDGNGYADIVLGNLEGPNTILWNDGDWRFSPQPLEDRGTRSVNLVDVDADGQLDIVTTHRGSGVAVFRNLGNRAFEQLPLVGVAAPAYSMAWGDIDGDGDLDLATGSYDAELDQHLRNTFLFSDGAGVFVYRNTGSQGMFEAERLADDSQALATAMVDLDHDGALDLVIGNDFAMPDMAWLNTDDDRLVVAEPFETISAHTMSIDLGDTDNDGIEEMFATDMKPATSDTSVLAEWLPLMATMDDSDDPFDPQRIRNVLQASDGDGTFTEIGERAGVDAAGWAWSGRFGDLDNDGDNDLHVVTGMIAAETFWYLDEGELREPNVTFSNRGDGTFEIVDWGLDARESGRGSVLVDLDNDGRLDVVVNNLDSASVAFENRLCGGSAIEMRLAHPASSNTQAVGARVTLHTNAGTQVRTVRSGGGYLSGSPGVLHFGVGEADGIVSAEVLWPDGTFTTIDDLAAGLRYEVVRR